MLPGLCEFVCDSDEEVSAILSVKQGNYFLIGTVRHQVGEIEPSAGRLLLFSMQAGDGTIRGEQGRSLDLKLLTSCDAEGCVYALVEIDGAIGAAVNTSVCNFFSSAFDQNTQTIHGARLIFTE